MSELSSRGKYIVFEGGENVGKSTQVLKLAKALGAITVREPGGTPAGEQIRSLLLNPDVATQPETEVLLHAAQRAELSRTVVRPALLDGTHVISDRSWISSASYQGTQGVDFEDITNINSYALGELLEPDLLLVLDADPEAMIARTQWSGDYYELREIDFHRQVRQNYLKFGKLFGAIVIDATQDIDVVADEIRLAVKSKLDI